MHRSLQQKLQDEIYLLLLDTMEAGSYCRQCRWAQDKYCMVDNPSKCPAVAAQLNVVEGYIQGIMPLTKETWLKDD